MSGESTGNSECHGHRNAGILQTESRTGVRVLQKPGKTSQIDVGPTQTGKTEVSVKGSLPVHKTASVYIDRTISEMLRFVKLLIFSETKL